jgi:glycosyltransferase involved in cell wall biosynthesis
MEVTLLMLLPSGGHISEFANFRIETLRCEPPYGDAPRQLVNWLLANPQQIVYFNSCEQLDPVIPYIPAGTRSVYVVHDSAKRYFRAALRYEDQLDAIVAVSGTVAVKLRQRLRNQQKLHVIHNGTIFPYKTEEVLRQSRNNDVIFLGGDNPMKGAYDVQKLWGHLQNLGFRGRLHWFGTMEKPFVEKVAGLSNPKNILIYGRAARSTIFEVAQSCKVFLMLSRVEPFGMATIECMGMGCTPIAWDIETGTKEIVGPEEGHFIRLGDYAGMARQVISACESHETVFSKSTCRIRDKFGEHVMAAKYEALATKLVLSRPAPRPMAGRSPARYKPPVRLFQLLPARLRAAIRVSVGKSAQLGYRLQNFRGY